VSRFPSPPLPSPATVRLVGAPASRALRPPLGIRAWSNEGAAVAVCLPRASAEARDVDSIAGHLPDPATLPPGTLVVVLADVAPHPMLLGRLLASSPRVGRELRTSALLARGYARLGGGVDARGQDLAWGYALT
jgi:hypothetical protein